MEIKEMICIACPLGCNMSVSFEDGKIVSVAGNSCRRGETYAQSECTDPRRSLTTTVKVDGGITPVVPVRSDGLLPKDKVLACAECLRDVTVEAPVQIGDVIVEDILGTGINVIATNIC